MIDQALVLLADRQDLPEDVATGVFEDLLKGSLDTGQIAALAMGLRCKGESVTELRAAVTVLRRHMLPVRLSTATLARAIDVCGTGGDGLHTLNVSTAVALIVAACGVPVAKHGNRAASSNCGSSDVLAMLGVKVDAPVTTVERCIEELGIGFISAPRHHPALQHVASIRRMLKIRTLFNLLGPLCNPAMVRRQLIGLFAPRWLAPVTQALQALGSEALIAVHGEGGLDEFALSNQNIVCEMGDVAKIADEDLMATLQLYPQPPAAYRGGDATHNARALNTLLLGERGAYRDVVCLNAFQALRLDRAMQGEDILSRWARVNEALDSGAALRLLDRWKKMSQQT